MSGLNKAGLIHHASRGELLRALPEGPDVVAPADRWYRVWLYAAPMAMPHRAPHPIGRSLDELVKRCQVSEARATEDLPATAWLTGAVKETLGPPRE
jgi:hypothetical protein